MQQQQEHAKANDASEHPVALFFHVFFKAAAMFMFLFGGFFTNSFILTFITCVLLCAFDFWTVKNVTGRLLVGLRWWNEVLEDGTTKWVFESRTDPRPVNRIDSLVFWTTLYLTPPIWLIVGLIVTGFQVKWLLVVIVAVILSSANTIGYWKCQNDASAKLRQYLTDKLVGAATSHLTNQLSNPNTAATTLSAFAGQPGQAAQPQPQSPQGFSNATGARHL